MFSYRRRLAIVGGALVLLSVGGAGLAQAAPASAPASSGATLTADEQTLGERFPRLRQRIGDYGFGRLARNLVHGTVTVLGRDGELVTLQFDHGTIAAIGDGSLSISEATGETITVATTDATRVRKVRLPSSLDALAVGNEVFVTSVVEDGSATARLIVVPVPRPQAPESSS